MKRRIITSLALAATLAACHVDASGTYRDERSFADGDHAGYSGTTAHDVATVADAAAGSTPPPSSRQPDARPRPAQDAGGALPMPDDDAGIDAATQDLPDPIRADGLGPVETVDCRHGDTRYRVLVYQSAPELVVDCTDGTDVARFENVQPYTARCDVGGLAFFTQGVPGTADCWAWATFDGVTLGAATPFAESECEWMPRKAK